MKNDYTKSFLVDQSPKQVFDAVMNVRGWWQGFYAEEITGKTEKLNDEFSFKAGEGAHNTTQKLVELVPEQRVVWLVTKSNLTFLDNKEEWKGTKLVFDITPKGERTEVRFTHEGLVPEIECYDSCTSAWSMYMEEKLLTLIKSMKDKSYSKTITVKATADRAYEAIKDFRGWWNEGIDGETDKMGVVFLYHYKDVHVCKMKLIEAIPGTKLVYEVVDNAFNFIEDKSEWVGTKLVFEISPEGEKTNVKFTHEGLTQQDECFEVCNEAWNGYIGNSLKNFIETGKGAPNPRDSGGLNAELDAKWGLNAKA